MYNDYFDFPEPSTGDIVFEELKRIILGTMKEEVKSELERLRKENEELRPYKEDRNRMQMELNRVKSDCERRIEAAEANAKSLTFEELFNEHLVEAWKASRKTVLPEKCDKCDKDRKIHFTSPMGNKLTEPCECSKGIVVYEPVPALLTRFSIRPKARVGNQFSDHSFDKPVYYWYSSSYSTTEGSHEFKITEWTEDGTDRIDDTRSFDKLNEWHSIFTSKERCQEFCDYLMTKEESTGRRTV